MYMIQTWSQTSYFGFVYCLDGLDKIFWQAIISVTWSTTRPETVDAIWKLVFLPCCSCSVATGKLFFFCERNSGLDLSKGGIRSPKSISERRKDSATLPPCPLDPIHRFFLRGVSWQFNISLYFEFHNFSPWLRIFYLHSNDTYWWSLVVHFFLTQFLIRTKLLQCISSAAL